MSNEFPKRVTDDELERYLDDQLSPEERKRIESFLQVDSEATEIVGLQHGLDHAIRENFTPPQVSVSQIEQLIAGEISSRQPAMQFTSIASRRLVLALTSLAAAITIILLAWNWDDGRRIQPHFEPRSLASIYRETVNQGFHPYYFCEDANRFALTFAKRQRTPLILAPMPADRRMVGLSYPGGLSRDTTAILCYVKEQPVMVFVDRSEVDNIDIANTDVQDDLFVHRSPLGDLVVYEVSPFPQSTCLDFLRLQFDSE